LFVFLVVDNGWTAPIHLLPVDVVSASDLVLACFGGWSLVVAYSTSSNDKLVGELQTKKLSRNTTKA